jgi:hypothetical protein
MAKFKSQAKQVGIGQFEDILDGFFGEKLPALPMEVKEFLVKFGPWLIVVSVILMLPAIFAALGLGAIAVPFAYLGGIRSGFNFSLGLIFALVIFVLNIMALPGLFGRKMSAWRLLFYSSLVMAVENLLSMNLSGLVVGSVIGWYVLFQIKGLYNK